ncbi:hypothetical protein [Bradyrhizobium erythrophlei]|uniref:hypothetical protein n=1 Tax=Bradyrhizobium erythrophlei TaxID=1437360 RepID=UPI00155FA7EC
MRIEIAREPVFAGVGGLVPCICKTPCWDIRRLDIRWKAIPRPHITPELGLEARDRFETNGFQQIAARFRRRLREIIRVDESRPSQILRDISQSDDGAPEGSESPDVNRRCFLVGARQKLAARVFKIDFFQQKRVMSPAIEIKKRDAAEQIAATLKYENRLRILLQEMREALFRRIDPRDFAPGNIHQFGQVSARSQADADRGAWRKPIQLVANGQVPTFSKHFLHLINVPFM